MDHLEKAKTVLGKRIDGINLEEAAIAQYNYAIAHTLIAIAERLDVLIEQQGDIASAIRGLR